MKRFLFASDLDNTLLFSAKHDIPRAQCVEYIKGKEQGFFSPTTISLLPEVNERTLFVPVTTRSIEQYERIQWPIGSQPPFAVTTNGAILLRDGKVDEAWYECSCSLVRPYEQTLRDIHNFLLKQNELTSAKIVDGMYVYACCTDVSSAVAFAEKHVLSLPLEPVVSGRKVYFFPPGINKGHALERLKDLMLPDTVFCAGDSLMDVSMLQKADYAFLPKTLNVSLPCNTKVKCVSEEVLFSDFILHSVLDLIVQTNKY